MADSPYVTTIRDISTPTRRVRLKPNEPRTPAEDFDVAAWLRPISLTDLDAIAPAEQCTPARLRFGSWLNRERRVLLTLAAVWVVGVFDYVFTLLEASTGYFVELNPVAARLLGGPDHVIAAFKFGMLGLGTVILLSLRRHLFAEMACWFLFAAKLFLAIRWRAYYYLVDAPVDYSAIAS